MKILDLVMKIVAIFVMGLQFAAPAYGLDRIEYLKAYKSKSIAIDHLIENTVLINAKSESAPAGINRGTGFYLGVWQGKNLFVTNAHVILAEQGASSNCSDVRVTILNRDLSRMTVPCESVMFSSFESEKNDIAVFTIAEKFLKDFIGKGLEPDWQFSTKTFLKVASAGFGHSNMTSNSSVDLEKKLKKFTMDVVFGATCVISSPSNSYAEIQKLKIDNVFATGCHGLEGDSGSALIDLETGKIIGLVFGASTKNVSVDVLEKLVNENSTSAWDVGTAAILFSSLKFLFQSKGINIENILPRP